MCIRYHQIKTGNDDSRECKEEKRALPTGAFDAYLSVQFLHDPFDNGQSQTVTVSARGV